ncbi:MAG: hypothetical protein NT166_04115, partial [Candidatus Aminicenantes bacterium]|nr:hypothetical protein [Candidatus Aminicenantes bacterium]
RMALAVNLYRMGVNTHRVSMKSFNALPERGASPLPGLTWRHKIRIAGLMPGRLTYGSDLYSIV